MAGIFECVQWQILFPRLALGHFQKPQFIHGAAGSLGYAAIFGKHWCFGEWPSAWKQFNITILEFFPIVLAIEIWGPLMRDKCIVFFSDNQAVVEIINRQTSKDRSGTLFSALLNTIFCFVLSTSLVALTARAMLYLAYR